jgi:hypothetical protein
MWRILNTDQTRGPQMTDRHVIATLERKGKVIHVSIRQMSHDEPLVIGKKYRYASGPMWTVLDIRESL